MYVLLLFIFNANKLKGFWMHLILDNKMVNFGIEMINLYAMR